MIVQAYCACGWTKRLSEFYAGKLVRCPQCASVIEVARPHSAYAVEAEAPPTPPAPPEAAAGGVPYGYPPYQSWTREVRPPVLPAQRPAGAMCYAWVTPQSAGKRHHSTFSDVMLTLATVYFMCVVGSIHPALAGGVGVFGAVLLLRGSRGNAPRRVLGATMLAVSLVLFFVTPWKSGGCSRSGSRTHRYVTPPPAPAKIPEHVYKFPDLDELRRQRMADDLVPERKLLPLPDKYREDRRTQAPPREVKPVQPQPETDPEYLEEEY